MLLLMVGEENDKELGPATHANSDQVVLFWIFLRGFECLRIADREGTDRTTFTVGESTDEPRKVCDWIVLRNVVVNGMRASTALTIAFSVMQIR